MEEAEAEEQFAVVGRLVGPARDRQLQVEKFKETDAESAPVQLVVVHLEEDGLEVRPETSGRFLRHLDADLHHRDGKVGTGLRREPQSKRLVDLVRPEVLDNSLQSRQPGHAQVAIL